MASKCSKQPSGKGEDSEGFTCLTPKSILSCWIRTKKSKTRRAYSNEESKKTWEEKSSGSFDDGERKIKSATSGPNYAESCQSCAPGDDSSSGNLKEVTFFNLGIGIGLVYLLCESKYELNKIKGLHKEMEVGLESLKDRLVAKEYVHEDNGSLQELQSSLSLKDPKIRSIIISRQQSRRKMNLLEEELEAELEHLQVHIESETMIFQEEKYSEIMVEDSAPEGSFYTTNYGEIVDPPPQVIYNEEQYGVSPYELESRLHEVLEARQQERINELEEALHRAALKVHEKERELSWWKDTAKLFFQHVPEHHERRVLAHH